jgi:lysophospholipase L1-like esterase
VPTPLAKLIKTGLSRAALLSCLFFVYAFGQTNPNFNLSMESPSLSLVAGMTATMTMQISAVPGYKQPVYLLASVLPPGVSVDIPSPIVGGQAVTMNLSATAAAVVQTVSVTIYAASSGETHAASFSLSVLPHRVGVEPPKVSPKPKPAPEPTAPSRWVGTWGASAAVPSNESGAYYLTNVTVRQIAHLSIGTARGLRIKLSNALGKFAVTFGVVHVAQWAGNAETLTSAIVPATDRIVTFGGSRAVVLPPGADVVSDRIVLPLLAGGDLAVSFYIPRTSNVPATMHMHGGQTAYFSLGDSAASTVVPNAITDTVRPYLTGIEVETQSATAVVALGDSITDGMLASLNRNARWPDDLARRLEEAFAGEVGVVNSGIGGNCLLTTCLGPSALERFERDVLAVSGVKYLIVLEGGTDIGNAPNLTAEQMIEAYRSLIALAHAHGIVVYGATITPFGGSNYSTAEHEQLRQHLNAFIRAGGAFDAVIDFDKVLANPANPTAILPQFDGDHIHPNDAGYQAMAEAVDLALFNPAAR